MKWMIFWLRSQVVQYWHSTSIESTAYCYKLLKSVGRRPVPERAQREHNLFPHVWNDLGKSKRKKYYRLPFFVIQSCGFIMTLSEGMVRHQTEDNRANLKIPYNIQEDISIRDPSCCVKNYAINFTKVDETVGSQHGVLWFQTGLTWRPGFKGCMQCNIMIRELVILVTKSTRKEQRKYWRI